MRDLNRERRPPTGDRVHVYRAVVLLDRAWYSRELTPLLAEWAELWLRAHGAARGVADHHMRAYLTRSGDVREACEVIEREAEDEALKMINLARDWICALLPHVLAKINRVSYGLLKPADVALLESGGGARVPSSRRLLAVPFVGKDIPSRTNEFSHPDIVIGLTICAHRHEGLRRGDFKTLLRGLLASLENETGPQGKRPSAVKWGEFVRFAGRRVRGRRVRRGRDAREAREARGGRPGVNRAAGRRACAHGARDAREHRRHRGDGRTDRRRREPSAFVELLFHVKHLLRAPKTASFRTSVTLTESLTRVNLDPGNGGLIFRVSTFVWFSV